MKSFIIVMFIISFSSTVICGIYRKPYFFDDDVQNTITSEVHIPLTKDSRIVGAPKVIGINDAYINKVLSKHLGRLITGDNNQITIDRIEEITQQIVAGSLYKIKGHYIIEGQRKNCVITVLDQPWVTEETAIISGKCDDGSCYVTESYTCSPESLYSTVFSREKRLVLFS